MVQPRRKFADSWLVQAGSVNPRRQCSARAFKMQCFICVAYLMLACTAHPPAAPGQRAARPLQRRSLFHDVIESIRLRAGLPGAPEHEDNRLDPRRTPDLPADELRLPGDSQYAPRRNDRIEMPQLKYRFPKQLRLNDSGDATKGEVVIYVNTPSGIVKPKPTSKPRKTPKPKPTNNRVTDEDAADEEEILEDRPISNNMSGQSQIGNRESQTVIKPTVIVNFRGSVNHRESEVRLERRKNMTEAQTVVNINQEIQLDKPSGVGGEGKVGGPAGRIKQRVRIAAERPARADDLLMCETRRARAGTLRILLALRQGGE